MQASRKKKTLGERPDLDRRYGKIGISAVAAAVRYQGRIENPKDVPIVPQLQDEREDAVA